MPAEDLFAENLDLIDRVLALAARRAGTSAEETEEFCSWARLRMIENDYRVLRRFEGKSKLSTYLAVVATNLFRDWRITRWGKWRPSATARRLGTLAVHLERLTVRDGHSLSEAAHTLAINHGLDVSEAELVRIARRLPRRMQRRVETGEDLDRIPVPPRVDVAAREDDRAGVLSNVREALEGALCGMSEQDRVLLRLRFEEGTSVADVARMFGVEHKALYRRYDRLLRQLRAQIVAQGLEFEQIEDLFDWHGLELSLAGPGSAGESELRPSQQPEAR